MSKSAGSARHSGKLRQDAPQASETPSLRGGDVPLIEMQIGQFASMQENWDGYGALAISGQTADNAIAALRAISRNAPVPDVTPNVNGTLSFEWESGRGVGHLEIGRTKWSFYIKPTTGAPVLLDGLTDHIQLNAYSIGIEVTARLFPELTDTSTPPAGLAVNVQYSH